MVTFIAGVSIYLLLCIISILAGAGLICLLRLALPLSAALVLAPILALVGWSLVLGIGVGFRVPLRYVSTALWGLTFFAICYLFSQFLYLRLPISSSHNRPSTHCVILLLQDSDAQQPISIVHLLRQGCLLIVCIVAPIVVLLPYFRYGITDYQGSIMPDGWAYTAMGQYLWQYPRGANGGLAPLYQYGFAISETRYIASSFLGFLSPFSSFGDIEAARTLFLAWSLFVFGSACALFGLAQSLQRMLICTYICLAVISGWVGNLIWATNYDNALALSYAPAIAGIIVYFRPSSWGWRITLGTFGAGLLYSYPELAPIIVVGPLLIFANYCWHKRSDWRSWLIALSASLAVTLLLILPFLPWLASFIGAQVWQGLQETVRAGEGFFPGLLIARYQPAAFWAIGGEYQIDTWLAMRNGLGVLLSVMAIIGLIRLLKHQQLGIASATILLCGVTAFFIIYQAYSYGAYKIVLLSWWLLCFALVFSLAGIADRLPVGYRSACMYVICLSLVAILLLFNRNGLSAPSVSASKYAQSDMAQYRSLEQIKPIIGTGTLLVAVDDWLANEWAFYFLRDIPLHVGAYRMYMAAPGNRLVMEGAHIVQPETADYVLTDSSFNSSCGDKHCWALLWSSGPYRLWQPSQPDWSIITDIANTNGVEQYQDQQFFWLSASNTTLHIIASRPGMLHMNATLLIGPIVATNQLTRTIEITNSLQERKRRIVVAGEYQLAIPVPGGESTIVLRALDPPLLSTGPNEDPRPRPVGFQGMTTSLDHASVILEHIDNPYGVEQYQGKQFFWMGAGDTTLNIVARQAGVVQISATFHLGSNVPAEQQTRTVEITTETGYNQLSVFTAGERTIELPVPQGSSRIVLRARDRPTVPPKPNSDPRLLVLGVQGLTISMQEPPTR